MLCYNWTTAGAISSSGGGQSITRGLAALEHGSSTAAGAGAAAGAAAAAAGVFAQGPSQDDSGSGNSHPAGFPPAGLVLCSVAQLSVGMWPKVATRKMMMMVVII